jgi:branched-chain amino acid transport system ATP-binding protein
MTLLETRSLTIRFSGLQALQDVNVRVAEFEIVGLIGPNGAGKTTFFDCVTGVYTHMEGHVLFRGVEIDRLPTHRRAALGIGRTFQNIGLVKTETVLGNLLSAQHIAIDYGPVSGMVGSPGSIGTERALRRRADALLEILGLGALRDAAIRELPYGTLKHVEIATALATDPDLLMLDEPSAGMGPEEAQNLGESLLALRKEFDLTILMIEHHVPLVMNVCDYVYVLNFGQLLTEGLPHEISRHPDVIAAYLGEEEVSAFEADASREAGF